MFSLIADAGRKTKRPPNPRAKANIFQIITFSWMWDLFKKGWKRDLNENDLYSALSSHTSSRLGDELEKVWKSEVENANKLRRNPSLFKSLVRMFGREYIVYGLTMSLSEIVFKTSVPLLIGEVLEYFNTAEDAAKADVRYVYVCACGLMFSLFMTIILQKSSTAEMLHCGMKVRIACCSVIYRKASHLSPATLRETTAGNVMNLLSNDASRFDTSLTFVHYLWNGPLQTIVVSYFLWKEMGVSSLIGLSTFLVFIPFQGWLGKKISGLRKKIDPKTDERIRLMNETVSGIQLIKMYTWEKPFSKLIERARKKEVRHLKSLLYIKSILLALAIVQSKIQLFIIITAYALLGNPITIKKIFVLISFYNQLGYSIASIFSYGTMYVAELLVSIKRIQNFLLLDEKRAVYPERLPPVDSSANVGGGDESIVLNGGRVDRQSKKDFGVVFSNVTAKWSPLQNGNSLNKISLKVKTGQLTAIVGPVGAGKSTLLQAILREISLCEGSVSVCGSISYASQEPWLFSGSIRQNIIFDSPMDRERYRRVIDACALRSDIEQFANGDGTFVGEKGVILSGGQRARLNLARAVYKKADNYLLDDPLSAVDTKVGKYLFEKCIKSFLAGKTRVLVTHQIQYLTKVNEIVVMKDGDMVTKGSYGQVRASGVDFARLLGSAADHPRTAGTESDAAADTPCRVYETGGESVVAAPAAQVDGERVTANGLVENPGAAAGTGARCAAPAATRVYFSYLTAGGNTYAMTCALFSTYLLTQLLNTGAEYWISIWATKEESACCRDNTTDVVRAGGNGTTTDFGETATTVRQTFVAVHTILIVALIVVALVSSGVFVSVFSSSSKYFHNAMFSSVTRTTMHFFNTNASGKILDRFTKDLGVIDETIPTNLLDCLRVVLTLLGVVIVMALVNIYLMIPAVIIGFITYGVSLFYFQTSRSIKRLEGLARSPIFSHMNESLQGLTTIRAYGAERFLSEEFDNHQDSHSSAWYSFIFSNMAFGFWLDLICLAYIGVGLFSFLVIGNSINTVGGLVGLAITQIIKLIGVTQRAVRSFVELQNQMTSVERVIEFIDSPQECPLLCAKTYKMPPRSWPNAGEIEFRNYHLRYTSNGPSVLKDLNFHVLPTEKIGIVGRTGAGKSSVVKALFRLAFSEGHVFIDGVNIDELRLEDLRSKIAIIPQEPVLFSGTLRNNLDPLDEFPDHALWNALDRVELKTTVENLPGGLNSKMSENGSNFSVGQRQLLCLARAIVRNNRILVLDEATANVDTQTDALIQKSIRNTFQKCTVLTIAHRLNTVMDSDRVLVMDAGRVVEFDRPSSLLGNEDGFFYSMVKETGQDTADSLHRMAARALATTTQTAGKKS